MFLLSHINFAEVVPVMIGTDAELMAYLTRDTDEVESVMSILGMNRFHCLVNTVLSYPLKSQRAAWIAYAQRYVEERVSAGRQRAYDALVARPAFGALMVYGGAEDRAGKYGPTEDEQAVNVHSAAYVR